MNENQDTLLSVASLSVRLAGEYMQPYSCSKSPHKFTQSQLMACLVLRAYLKTTYRGIIDLLGVSEELRSRLGLKHFLTILRSTTLPIAQIRCELSMLCF